MNHYDTLEVSPKASAEVIRAAYKSLMQRHHPDKLRDAARDNPMAANIAQAYGILSDPVQRAAYDLQLQPPAGAPSQAVSAAFDQPATPRGRARPRSGLQTRASNQGKSWQLWYAWGLIVVILITGGFLLAQSKKRGDIPLRPQDAQSDVLAAGKGGMALPSTPASMPGLLAPETPEQLMARTVMPYALDLSVELRPAQGVTGSVGNILSIAELGLRIGTAEPQRWIQKVQAQRQDILRLVMVQLANARVEALTQPEADLYLKSLIANTVATAINLPPATAAPASPPADPTLQPAQPIEVLLPQGFRLR